MTPGEDEPVSLIWVFQSSVARRGCRDMMINWSKHPASPVSILCSEEGVS